MTVRQASESLGLTFEGDGERVIVAAAPLDAAGAEEAAFFGNRKAFKEAAASSAGCLIVPLDFDNTAGRTVIRARDPRLAMARLIRLLNPPPPPSGSVDGTAVVDTSARIGENCAIGPQAVVGANAEIGAGTRIGAGAAIGAGVRIGPGSVVYPRAVVYDGVEIGERAVVHSGVVLGADGFGFVFDRDHYEKFPQVGKLVIGDDFEIGANSTIDRAALGVTRIGNGVKLDNMVHIGHNCVIGNHVVIAAQTGIAGGSKVEDYAVIGGQVGIGDNVTVKAQAVIGSGAGILSSKIVKGGGEVHWGTPARPLREYLETLANLSRLPELRRRVAAIEETLKRLMEKE